MKRIIFLLLVCQVALFVALIVYYSAETYSADGPGSRWFPLITA